MSFAIRAENVGKKYVIAHRQPEPYVALRDVLAGAARQFAGAFVRASGDTTPSRSSREEFWALRGLGFEIAAGDRVGIIGRNGAGKSTLLKILSRITEPTTGQIRIRGRVASLLEVGTGFHPELTGRENIFLNAAILGMTKSEIRRKFDDVVAFSEVERFLDTPVKRYSSGMYVRLAFAVAAHVEPEILIVDEVLAVGDAAFQKKCLGKMGEVQREGRTVLFVSHNMSAVRQLCDRSIVLNRGEIVFNGAVGDAIQHYQNSVLAESGFANRNPAMFDRPKENLPIYLYSLAVLDRNLRLIHAIEYEEPFFISLELQIVETSSDYYSALIVHDEFGNNVIFTTDEDLSESPIAGRSKGTYRYDIAIPGKFLKPGIYTVTPVACLKMKGKIDRRDAAIQIEVQDTRTRRGTRQLYRTSAIVAPEIPWRLSSRDEAHLAAGLPAAAQKPRERENPRDNPCRE